MTQEQEKCECSGSSKEWDAHSSHSVEAFAVDGGAHGTLRGQTVIDGSGSAKCRRFLGIPFAKPPVGELRWKSPVPLPKDAKWDDIDATKFAPIALQPEYLFQR